MRTHTVSSLALVFVFIAFFSTAPTKAAEPKKPAPDHVLIMVFDQMRPDYIQRFQLKNFQRLIKISQNYPNAIVGHSASITIVSHAVIPSGLPPKELPWMDDVLWDKQGLIGKPDLLYQSTRLNMQQMLKGLSSLPVDKQLPALLKKKFSKPVFAVGEKNYATIAMGGPSADSITTMKREDNHCVPFGVNVPAYISSNERYAVDCKEAYGTEDSFYPMDGNHFYPGRDPKHLGGDVWTADIALDIMNHEDWAGLFLTFGAIDKFGHLTGEDDGDNPLSFNPPAHLKEICEIADAQLGKILDALEAKKLLDRTLIISTADHGGQTDRVYLGNGDQSTAGDVSNAENADKKKPLPFWLQRLFDTGKVRLAFADTSIRVWLNSDDTESSAAVLRKLKEVSGVTRIVQKQKDAAGLAYHEVFQNLSRQPKRFQDWANKHDIPLANTMASETGPDFIAMLADQVGFQKLGDHGGMQEMVQRIPMIVHIPGKSAGTDSKREFRLIDIYPTVVKELKL